MPGIGGEVINEILDGGGFANYFLMLTLMPDHHGLKGQDQFPYARTMARGDGFHALPKSGSPSLNVLDVKGPLHSGVVAHHDGATVAVGSVDGGRRRTGDHGASARNSSIVGRNLPLWQVFGPLLSLMLPCLSPAMERT